MNVDELEQRIALQTSSPLFARLAGEYLTAGRLPEARELCLSGLRYFPHYATAHLILAKCLAQENNYSAALSSLQNVQTHQPGSSLVLKYRTEWEAHLSLPASPLHEEGLAGDDEGGIVSKTLAEIYAGQGEYGEAIVTYKLLRRKKPDPTGEIDERIRELEAKLQVKLAQQQ